MRNALVKMLHASMLLSLLACGPSGESGSTSAELQVGAAQDGASSSCRCFHDYLRDGEPLRIFLPGGCQAPLLLEGEAMPLPACSAQTWPGQGPSHPVAP
jgi:hypothetical protein